MHVFLTGLQKVGKSTALARSLERLGVAPIGFRTYFGPDRGQRQRWLYLCGAEEANPCDEAHRLVWYPGDGRKEVLVERFDRDAAAMLRRGREQGSLILMDECGYLEKNAMNFQGEVLRCLDGEVPVLGVVRLKEDGWTQAIRQHPKVTLLTVTEENRDSIPEQVEALLKPYLK